MTIPYLLTVTNIRVKGRTKCWRPTKAEVREGFLCHVHSNADVKTAIEERRSKLLQFGLTLQPFIVIVGPNVANIESYFVVVNDVLYRLRSILSTVDVCYKVTWAMNAVYSSEAHSVRMFLQKACYKMRSSYDKESKRQTPY